MLVGRDAGRLQEVATRVGELGAATEILPAALDIADEAAVAALYATVARRFGNADVLVNNAGVLRAAQSVREVDSKIWWGDFVSLSHLLLPFLGGGHVFPCW